MLMMTTALMALGGGEGEDSRRNASGSTWRSLSPGSRMTEPLLRAQGEEEKVCWEPGLGSSLP